VFVYYADMRFRSRVSVRYLLAAY